ncbi:hypothetical protein H696_03102 [Fonticula alba]|uniref:Phosphatidic acid phosphatase type 2/haloperoxidase domain-containing protein n=1 Tax=Fonticula alba TaxID=691883 RepID=A0A058Z9G7_FONAL|nr:hypothetical protein H696_03102 [Fonticula alba]KCV70751.1 hypothetical protein H696_03102 [Fonticula alba]|eukprot:XP_009495267.1 hypothetical protein H696_03102 [Fonticula alba]
MSSDYPSFKEVYGSPWFFLRTIFPDLVGLLIIGVSYIITYFLLPLHERPLPGEIPPPETWLPVAEPERVPNAMLIIICLVCPTLIVLLGSLMRHLRRRRPDIVEAIICFATIVGITLLATHIFKEYVGRFRPDFWSRCMYDAVTKTCTGAKEIVDEGRRSFPSGHSSFSFSALGFAGLYIYENIDLLSNDLIPCGRRAGLGSRGFGLRAVLASIPFVGAGLIALSRVVDNRHHPGDILAGGILGLIVLFVVFYSYFPVERHYNRPPQDYRFLSPSEDGFPLNSLGDRSSGSNISPV